MGIHLVRLPVRCDVTFPTISATPSSGVFLLVFGYMTARLTDHDDELKDAQGTEQARLIRFG